jgi:integrase
MLMHVAVRPGELRGATWGEFNVGERLWTIPGARMKKNLDHVVPLTDQSLDLLAQIRIACADLRGVPPQELRSDDLVLPHAFDFARPISDNTLNHAVWRAGYKSRHCAHGCRSVFSSWANEIGKFNPDAVERQLAHVTAGPVRKAYNRAEYLDERIRMMHAWSAYLEGQERTATIIPFPVAAAS